MVGGAGLPGWSVRNLLDFHQPHQHEGRNVSKAAALPSCLAPTTPWQVHTVHMPWTVASDCCLHARAQPEKAPMDFHQPHQHAQRNVGKSVALPSLLAPTTQWQVHTVPMPWTVPSDCCLHARAQPEKHLWISTNPKVSHPPVAPCLPCVRTQVTCGHSSQDVCPRPSHPDHALATER